MSNLIKGPWLKFFCLLFMFVLVPSYLFLLAENENFSFGVGSNRQQDSTEVGEIPSSYNFHPFYKKYIDANGIPVISSENVPASALIQARAIVLQMLEKRRDVKTKLESNKVRVAVMAKDEQTTDIPEHKDLNKAFPGTNWDIRARGLGATKLRPAVSCAEENLLCYGQDPYHGEDILVHEFAHTIHTLGIQYIDTDFDGKLSEIYDEAMERQLWANTYAASNYQEYFAEGVQCWYNVNKEVTPSDGVHNHINTRAELKVYDPKLYQLISLYFAESDNKVSCH